MLKTSDKAIVDKKRIQKLKVLWTRKKRKIMTQVSHPFYLSKALNCEGQNKFLKQNIMPVTSKTAPIYKLGTVFET